MKSARLSVSHAAPPYTPAKPLDKDLRGYLQTNADVVTRVTKPVSLDLEFNGVNPGMGHGEVAGFEASVVLNRKDFGIDIDMPLETGGTVVGDKVTITLDIEALKQA